jgi:thiol-disulfide isomerase/thioredoxin
MGKAACGLVCLTLLTPALFAAGSLPGCESPAELRAAIDDLFQSQRLSKLTLTEQMKFRRDLYERLVKEYPREWESNRRLIRGSTQWGGAQYAAEVRERYVKAAADRPDDPLALALAGFALFRVNTPEAIRLLEAALAKADFPWPHLDLAEIYSTGRFSDPAKASEHLRAFFRACPGALHDTAHGVLAKAQDRKLQGEIAAEIRKRLEAGTRPPRPQDWERLWGLEFRSTPPQEHAALRKQVAEDLKRLEARKTSPEEEWLVFLRNGYRQAGAPPDVIRALEDRILAQPTASFEAFQIVSRRHAEAVKPPADPKDVEGWNRYRAQHRKTVAAWKRQFPALGPRMFSHMELFAALDDVSASEEEIASALDAFLQAGGDPQPSSLAYVAEAMLDRGVFPARALDLAKQAMKPGDLPLGPNLDDDTLTPAEIARRRSDADFEPLFRRSVLLRAALAAGKPEDLAPHRAAIESATGEKPDQAWQHDLNRARLARIEGRKADALAYYQAALHTRPGEPRYIAGRLRDPLTLEARELWRELGGSDATWAAWSRPSKAARRELTEGRWERPVKPLPPFELPDLTGKVWRLRSLEGKAVLINLWATWCGPCQAELPRLQTLYEQTRNRNDLQILALNVDEQLGVVEPFLKEKGYTFPVLAAYEFSRAMELEGIPQNWLVDAKGVWRWVQMGFDAQEQDWAGSMLKKIESLSQP